MPEVTIARFRRIALFEGVSFLLLLGVAMPLKYLAGMPIAVRVVGLVHGVLFLAYAAAVAHFVFRGPWSFGRGVEAMVYGVLPFGTFYFDRKLRREEAAAAASLPSA